MTLWKVLTWILLVFYSTAEFLLEPGDNPIIAVTGQTVTVPCVLAEASRIRFWAEVGNPQLINLDNDEIKKKFPQYSLNGNGPDFSLTISNVQLDQPQVYCIRNLQASSLSDLTILAPPSNGYPTCSAEPSTVQLGSRVRLTCQSTGGVPASDLAWTDNDGRVINTAPVYQLQLPSGRWNTTLDHVIDNVAGTPGMNHTYTCLARNKATEMLNIRPQCSVNFSVEAISTTVRVSSDTTSTQKSATQTTEGPPETDANPEPRIAVRADMPSTGSKEDIGTFLLVVMTALMLVLYTSSCAMQ